MTHDSRLSVAYNLCHPDAGPDAIKVLIERLRQRAIDLGFVRVGELICHTSQGDILGSEFGERFFAPDLEIVPALPAAACYFVCSLSDSDPLEIGLALFPCAVEIEGQAVPFGQPTWMWTGATRTRDLKTFSKLLHHAAEIGIETFFSFAGISMIYSPHESGRVKVQQEWDVILDEL